MATRQSEAVRKPPRGLLDSGTVAGVSDGQLLARFSARRDELAEVAFAALVRRHGAMVLQVCRQILGDRHTAEDAFQATFLILARRAGSIRQPELLGHWLYGVALRTAREARMRDDRRRRRESQSPPASDPGGEAIGDAARPERALLCREDYQALHEEVSRLPERYRVAVVLCELEGLTYQEAAQRLHCPVGTIGVRLRRARERLRVRLTRRGLAPSAGLLGALVGAEAASAWLPSALLESTIGAATRFAAREAAATGLVSARVVALTEAVLRAMALTRLKMATRLVLAVGLTATVGWVGVHRETAFPAATVAAKSDIAGGGPGSGALPARVGVAGQGPHHAIRAPLEFGRTSEQDKEVVGDPLVERSTPTAVAAPVDIGPSPRVERAHGEALFAREWVANDPSGRGDGLGPVYNESSCMACHGLGAPGGAGPESKNVVLVSATPIGSGSAQGLDQLHPGFRGARSTVLHRFGTDPEYASWRRRFYEFYREEPRGAPPNRNEDLVEGRIRELRQQTTPDRRLGDHTPRVRTTKNYTLTLSERNPPALFGAGRIDEIPSLVLVDAAERQPADIRGRVSRTREGRIGRFGWKAQIGSLHEFVRAACANELGLEVPGHSQAASPLDPDKPARGLDLTEPQCDALVSYIRALPAPVVIDPAGPRGSGAMREGRRLFADVGCASCHTPTLGDVRGIYSDLLLHDMGPGLNDSGIYYGPDDPGSPGGPNPQEWRTPPLWGYRDSGPYLHDGRAQTLEEAVALHDGQARESAHRFFSRSALERSQVEAFLKSLVAPASAAAPGVIRAADLESRIEQEERHAPETLVRRRREEAVARDEQQWRNALLRRRAEEAARRARVQLPAARNLEKMGKIAGALTFYREIAREAPDTEEGRLAAERIAALGPDAGSP